MKPSEIVDLFRSEVNDVATPQLWPDTEVYGYLDDAQIEFCRQTGGLGDSSSSLTQLPVVPGDIDVNLSPLILKIRDAWYQSDGVRVEPVNHTDLSRLNIKFDGATGRPQYLIFGMEPGKARWYPTPVPTDAQDTVQLVVDRLPLREITQTTGQEIELDRQHHRHLTMWMRHLAYLKQDSETRDEKKAKMFEDAFAAYCFKAMREKARALHKTRVVRYGGIGGGSSMSSLGTKNNDYYNRN